MLLRLIRRLEYWLHRRRHEADLAAEMAFHRSLVDGRAFGNATLSQRSWLVPRAHNGLLYGVSRTDPLTLAAACAAVMLVATGAGLIPFTQAARGDPRVA